MISFLSLDAPIGFAVGLYLRWMVRQYTPNSENISWQGIPSGQMGGILQTCKAAWNILVEY